MSNRNGINEFDEPGPADPVVGRPVAWASGGAPADPAAAHPTSSYPQDAPIGPGPSIPPLGGGQPSSPTGTEAAPVRRHHPVREVTHLPAPGAPNWGLVLSGLAFMVIAAGVILNQVNGFQVRELQQVGPMLLVGVGVACALIGVIGLVARRGR